MNYFSLSGLVCFMFHVILSQCLVSYGHITHKIQNHFHTIFNAVVHRHYSMAVSVDLLVECISQLMSLMF